MERRITLVAIPIPRDTEVNVELQWFGSSLGLFNLRDKDKSCFRIFVTLLKGARYGRSLTSDELAAMLGLSRGTVMHHVNKLMHSGIVLRQKNKYGLRMDRLTELIDEIKRDTQQIFGKLMDVAQDIEKRM